MKDMEEEIKKIKREREEEASSNRRAEAELEATQRQLNELLRYHFSFRLKNLILTTAQTLGYTGSGR